MKGLSDEIVEAAHAAGRQAGAITVVDEVIAYVQERLASAEQYSDTRPYTDLLVYLADKRRDLECGT